MSLQDYRNKYPEYDDIPDDVLVQGLYQKYGEAETPEHFSAKIGYGPPAPIVEPETTAGDVLKAAGRGIIHGTLGLGESIGGGLEYAGHRLENISDISEQRPDIAWSMMTPVQQAESAKLNEKYLKVGLTEEEARNRSIHDIWRKDKAARKDIGKTISQMGKVTAKYWGSKAERFETAEHLKGKKVTRNPEILLDPQWWAYGVGDLVPTLVATVIPGAVAYKGLKAAGIAANMTPEFAAGLARVGALVTGGAAGGALEGSATYRMVLEDTENEQEAARAAEGMFLLAGGLNALSVGKFLAKAGPGFKGKIIKGLGAGAWEGLTEGLEEPAEVTSLIASKILTGQPVQENIAQMFLESIEDGLTVAPLAAVTGLAGGGAGGQQAQIAETTEEDVIWDEYEKSKKETPLGDDKLAQDILEKIAAGGLPQSINKRFVAQQAEALTKVPALPAGQGFQVKEPFVSVNDPIYQRRIENQRILDDPKTAVLAEIEQNEAVREVLKKEAEKRRRDFVAKDLVKPWGERERQLAKKIQLEYGKGYKADIDRLKKLVSDRKFWENEAVRLGILDKETIAEPPVLPETSEIDALSDEERARLVLPKATDEEIIKTAEAAKKVRDDLAAKAEPEVEAVKEADYKLTGSQKLSEWVAAEISKRHYTKPITWKNLFNAADKAFGGTQAEGAYVGRDAYDAMEMGVNQRILDSLVIDTQENIQQADKVIKVLKEEITLLPTQTKRTKEQQEYQQFSTPPPLAYIANWAANIKIGESYLEPSAGTGGLAVFGKMAGAEVQVNELSPRRAALLKTFFKDVFTEDAEQLDNILPDDVKPTVIVMNPPFSATAGRVAKNASKYGARHIEQALNRLEPGGRLVAIVGKGMSDTAPKFKPWWAKIRKKYTVKANIGISGKEYKKYGTTFDNRLLVIDKTGPSEYNTVVGNVLVVEDLIPKLREVRDDRIYVSTTQPAKQPTPSPPRGETPSEAEGIPTKAPVAPVSTAGIDDRGRTPDTGVPFVEPVLGDQGRRPGQTGIISELGEGEPFEHPIGPGRGTVRGTQRSVPGAEPVDIDSLIDEVGEEIGYKQPTKQAKPSLKKAAKHVAKGTGKGLDAVADLIKGLTEEGQVGGQLMHPEVYAQAKQGFSESYQEYIKAGNELRDWVKYALVELKNKGANFDVAKNWVSHFYKNDLPQELPIGKTKELQYTQSKRAVEGEISDSLYNSYTPQVKIAGAKPHPTPLAQSAAMADTNAPPATYTPMLPEGPIKEGLISDVQLEAVIAAGQAHEQKLVALEKEAPKRKGFFIGDGTGVGKGREISAIMWDNWNRGRKKAIWISESAKLIDDAKRDLIDVGWKEGAEKIFSINKTKLGQKVTNKEGILFSTYATMRGGFNQIRTDNEDTLQNMRIRLNQIREWFGKDYDGVIAWDESHNMANAIAQRGVRGVKKPSQQAIAGIMLQQEMLPNSRVLYVSATGATEVSNFAYVPRLGLWGPGTAFEKQGKFIEKVTSGGLAGMEMVARDMKAMGLYTARSLSYDGVEYRRLEHPLTDNQKSAYDELSSVWQLVLGNINTALDQTEGKHNWSAFWNGHQRFFEAVVTSFQMPSALNDMEKQIADGNSVVIQLTKTGDAQTKRVLERKQEGQEIEDLDFTPREQLIDYVRNHFPVQQFEEYEDEEGKKRIRPVLDSTGEPVLNKEAVKMRESLIARLSSIKVPASPLDIIVQHFGQDKVAEVTGRSRRAIFNKEGELVIEKRTDKMTSQDADAFMDDEKPILVFSQKGGTGRSYHSDMRVKNQRRRIHYLAQPGWRADKAIQGLGRTHRSNQASEPEYVLLTTDLQGQKRFISSIARRLDQLGALTKGQRQTGSQGIFQARDNLESGYARNALGRFWDQLLADEIEDLDVTTYQNQAGLKLLDAEGEVKENMPGMKQFLNRLLSMNIKYQNIAFNKLSDNLDDIIQEAAERGTLDVGIETITGDSIKKTSEQTVYTDETTGAETKYVTLDITNPANNLSFEDSKQYYFQKKNPVWYQNIKSSRIWVASDIRERTTREGDIEAYHTLKGAGPSSLQRVSAEDLKSDKWEKMTESRAKEIWDTEFKNLPETVTNTEHVITGTLLPIWDRLIGKATVYRMQTDEGQRILGRRISPNNLGQTLKNLGVGREKVEMTGQVIADKVINEKATVRLANKWRFKRSKVSGEYRIELVGPDYYTQDEVVQAGGYDEVVNFSTRFFIPIKDAGNIIDKLIKHREIVSVQGGYTGPSLTDRVDRIKNGLGNERGSFSWAKSENTPLGEDLLEVGRDLISQGHTTYSKWRLELKKLLSEYWNKIKLAAYHIYKAAKRPLVSQRGEVTLREAKKEPEIQETKKDLTEYASEAADYAKSIFDKRKKGWKKERPDTTVTDRIISTLSHHAEKVPALQRVVNAGLDWMDNKHRLSTDMLTSKDDESYVKIMDTYRKQDRQEFKRWKRYIIKRDRNKTGYSVKKEDDTFKIYDSVGQHVDTQKTEDKAWGQAVKLEAEDFKKAGFSDQATDALIAYRSTAHNTYHMLSAGMENLITKYKEQGKKLPDIAVRQGGDTVTVNLEVALKMMGDMRGYYMPRLRRSGQYRLIATKKGASPYLQFFDTKTGINIRHAQLEKQGYKVEKETSKSMPEVVFELAGRTIGSQQVVNQALENIGQKSAGNLSEFGLSTDWEKYKDEDHFVVRGAYTSEMRKAFESLGGRWYATGKETKAWHFANAPANIEDQIVRRIHEVKGIDPDIELLFSGALIQNVADIWRARGARSRMIKRGLATGEDVWLGYEEDPIIAVVKSAHGIAGAQAKHQMALDMLKAIAGTDISWKTWKTWQQEEGVEKPDYKDYLKFVKARRIEAASQKNAFLEATTYFKDMMRNEEAIDRLVGTLKGVAVLKYLGGRVSAPLVNLTALVTSVPAGMKGYANIPLRSAMKYVGKGSEAYYKYRWGDKNKLDKWTLKALEDSDKNGWHHAQYNMEALSVLQAKLGRGWNKALEYSMLMFGETERLNRVSTIIGSYMGIKAQHKEQWNESDHQLALQLAKKVSDRSHGVYGKANLPHFARGSNIAAQVARSFYVFRTFSHNYLLTMRDLGFNKKQRTAALYMALSPALFAGIGASVLTPIINMVLKKLFDQDDPEEAMYEFLEQEFGSFTSNLARYGIFGMGGYGVSLKGSLAIGITDLPTSIADILGAPGSVIGDVYKGGRAITQGDFAKGTEKIAPSFIGSMVRGWREYSEGLSTRTNAPIFYGVKQARPTFLESAFRFLSFNPAGVAEITEKRWKEFKVEGKYRERRTQIYSKISRYFLKPTAKRSQGEWADILLEIREYNERIRRKKLIGIMPIITKESIKANLKRKFRPRKKEIRRRYKSKYKGD